MKTVMIVDDEIMVRVGMKSLIDWESQGFTVTAECSNGREALDRIAEHEPDLILTDLMMDEMDGFALMEECRQRYPEIKFIILSNYNDFENTRRAIRNGALDYIFKLTITPGELAEILQRAKKHLVRAEPADDSFVRKNLTGIKAHLIRTAAEGSCKDWESLQSDLARVAPRMRFDRPYCVLHLSIDEPSGGAAKLADLQLMKYGIENMIEEVTVTGSADDTTARIFEVRLYDEPESEGDAPCGTKIPS